MPCHTGNCPKVPKGDPPCPESAVTLSVRNERATWYAQQCDADTTGVLSRDAVTVRNNAILTLIRKSHERTERAYTNALLKLSAGVKV